MTWRGRIVGGGLISGIDMNLPLVYIVCIGFMLVMAFFFFAGAAESNRSH